MSKILIALGGNAIKQATESGSKDEQMRNVDITCQRIVEILKANPERRLVLTHGNGPQAGNLAVQQDVAKDVPFKIPAQPFDIVGAMTQGQIGYMFQNRLQNRLRAAGVNIPVICVINQVVVDKNDREFQGENASKPVGNFMSEAEAMAMKAQKKWIVKNVKPSAAKGWRRVVPSPDPIRNAEAETIRRISDSGAIVIASGGGGIPVIVAEDGELSGVEAVIDKDLAGERLAEAVGADTFLILTDVEAAQLRYGKPDAQVLHTVTRAEAEKYLAEGHFLAGSMGPKVKACVRHMQRGGARAIIASLDHASLALEGKAGTQFVP